MRIKLAGGVGEHGRNSFLVEGESLSFLVDVGVMEHGYPYPDLEDGEIRRIRYIFLTHSHNDHSGALPYLLGKGFRGTVIASPETLRQLPFSLPGTMEASSFRSFPVKYGRTGHCMGSLWYLMEFEGKRLFFSGDYLEESMCYEVDRIRGIEADIALLDSAYGSMDGERLRKEVKAAASSLSLPAVLPVPKYGRGFEVLSLIPEESEIYGDSHFISELSRVLQDGYWVKSAFKEKLMKYTVRPLLPEPCGYTLISDPQLRNKGNLDYALAASSVLLTGTVKEGSGSMSLLISGKAKLSVLPVHSTDKEREKLERENSFKIAVPNHTSEHGYPEKEIYLH